MKEREREEKRERKKERYRPYAHDKKERKKKGDAFRSDKCHAVIPG